MESSDKKKYSFGVESRISLDRDVGEVIHCGRRINEDFLVFIVLKRETAQEKSQNQFSQRIAIKISSRVANAVRRNRIKRWIREIFRHERIHWLNSIDIVIIVKPFKTTEKLNYIFLREKILSCCQKAEIVIHP